MLFYGAQIAQARIDLRISGLFVDVGDIMRRGATGMGIPAPVSSFAHMAHVLGKEIMEAIEIEIAYS